MAAAGFNVNAELLAVGRYRVYPSDWAGRLRTCRARETAAVLVARRGKLPRFASGQDLLDDLHADD